MSESISSQSLVTSPPGAETRSDDVPTPTLRKIIHCDCDCFYASIEMRDDPSLRGRPLAVGGSSERRGVVATCNYEARAFGIRSAMSTAAALRRCPELIVVPPRMEVYREVSRQIHDIFRDYTDLIEPLSLDEAYLDVSDTSRCRGSATLIAAEIRQRVRETLGITLSAGVAPNKFLAKIASDWHKPDGQFVILPADVDAFVRRLPVTHLFGVGKVTAARLHGLGIRTCEDLREWTEEALVAQFGVFGTRLFQLCRGHDPREVRPERTRKSISVETTYAEDLSGLAACQDQLATLYQELSRRWRGLGQRYRVSGKYVKVRFNNFLSTTAEQATDQCDDTLFATLMEQAWLRHQRPVRLLGVGFRLEPKRPDDDVASQLTLPL